MMIPRIVTEGTSTGGIGKTAVTAGLARTLCPGGGSVVTIACWRSDQNMPAPSFTQHLPKSRETVDHVDEDRTPHTWVRVSDADGAMKKIRVLEGQIFVCQGCCCGNTERGRPAVPLEDFKREWRERGLRSTVHLTIAGCLGPCALANVVLILFAGSAFWLHSVNSAQHVRAIYDYIETMQHAGQALAPSGLLASCHFNRYIFDIASGASKEVRPVSC